MTNAQVRRAVFFGVALAAALLLLLSSGAQPRPAYASHEGGPDFFLIDMDPSAAPANTATSYGTIETCARINENDLLDADEDSVDTLEIDIIVDDIPPYDEEEESGLAILFSGSFNYPAPHTHVAHKNFTGYIASSKPGSGGLDSGESVPDTDGQFDWAVLVVGADAESISPDGSGVIGRIGLGTNAGASSGVYGLSLTRPGIVDVAGNGWRPDNAIDTNGIAEETWLTRETALPGARIAIDAPCPTGGDVKISAATIAGPSGEQESPFDVDVDVTVHNNGPSATDVTIYVPLSLPPDCATPSGVAVYNMTLDSSVPVSLPTTTFPVTCSTAGEKPFVSYVGLDIDGIGMDVSPVNNTGFTSTLLVAISSNDTDGDGVLNAADLCPGTAPADPVDSNGCSDAQVDPDGDGLCSPGAPSSGPSGCTGTDNCPDHANPAQENFDGDSLGDACDPDDDNDAFSDVDEAGMPLCGDGRNEDSHDDTAADDGCPGGPPQEGQFSEAQFNIGTDPLDPCGTDGWPPDLVEGGFPDSTNRVDLLDLTSFLAPTRRLDTSPGDAGFNKRWDLQPGKGPFTEWINIADVTRMLAGPTGYPPMLGGARAFGGPECPFPP